MWIVLLKLEKKKEPQYGNSNILTWKMATAFDNNRLNSPEEANFQFRTLHLISRPLLVSKPFSSYFFSIILRRESGSFSSPWATKFSKAAWIRLQSMQQNQFPSGNSWKITSPSITAHITEPWKKKKKKKRGYANRTSIKGVKKKFWHLQVLHVMILQTANMVFFFTLEEIYNQ